MAFAQTGNQSVVSDKTKPSGRMGQKATGSVRWVSRVAKERHNHMTMTGLSANRPKPGFWWHEN